MSKKTWKLSVTLEVADTWVADGFNASDRVDEIAQRLADMLPYATPDEVKVKVEVTAAPTPEIIRHLQDGLDGYCRQCHMSHPGFYCTGQPATHS